MIIEERVQQILTSAAGVTAIVPAARIKTPGDWQNLVRPYIVHFPVGLRTNYTHAGIAALRFWDFYQVSCFADSYSQARLLAEAVDAALTGNKGLVTFFLERHDYFEEPETKIHHVSHDYRVGDALAAA